MAKKQQRSGGLLTRLFGSRNPDLPDEEQMQSPGRMVLRQFLHNRLGMLGLIIFLCLFLSVVIGRLFIPLDLSQQDNTQVNVPPGRNLLEVPASLQGQVQDIAPGTTYAAACDTDGTVCLWGYTRVTDTINLANIPAEISDAHIVRLAAGYDHVVALDRQNKLYVWGNQRLRQGEIPTALTEHPPIRQIAASCQFSAAVTQDGHLYLWGNDNLADLRVNPDYNGKIAKVALTDNSCVALLQDGSVVYPGQ